MDENSNLHYLEAHSEGNERERGVWWGGGGGCARRAADLFGTLQRTYLHYRKKTMAGEGNRVDREDSEWVMVAVNGQTTKTAGETPQYC